MHLAYLGGADLKDANLCWTYLHKAEHLTIAQLSGTLTLYMAQLDGVLLESLEQDHPHLLEEPDWLSDRVHEEF
jgi:hypothetical protein